MSLLPQQLSPYSRIFMDILDFHSKSRLPFGMLSYAYLIVQIFNLLELQKNYLRYPYDAQTKISFYIQEK